MVKFIVFLLFAIPAVVCLVAVVYELTRPKDRIQLATLALFGASLLYFAFAYSMSTRGDEFSLFSGLVTLYALLVYVCMGALAIFFKPWAWRASIAVFLIHIASGLAGFPSAQLHGVKGILALAFYLLIAVIGLWALLHRGSRNAVLLPPSAEA